MRVFNVQLKADVSHLVPLLQVCKIKLKIRDGWISDPAIQIWPDFHCPAKSTSNRIACYMPDWIAANYCINISQAICECSLLTDVKWTVCAGASRALM